MTAERHSTRTGRAGAALAATLLALLALGATNASAATTRLELTWSPSVLGASSAYARTGIAVDVQGYDDQFRTAQPGHWRVSDGGTRDGGPGTIPRLHAEHEQPEWHVDGGQVVIDKPAKISIVDEDATAQRTFQFALCNQPDQPELQYSAKLTDPGGQTRSITGTLTPNQRLDLGSTPVGEAPLDVEHSSLDCESYPFSTRAANPQACAAPLVEGSPGPDPISGTPSYDRINGYGGADDIDGGEKSDCLSGFGTGPGGGGQAAFVNDDDRVRGGGGNDIIWGDYTHDDLDGQGGNDVLRGGHGNDHVVGGLHGDELWGDGVFYAEGIPNEGYDFLEDFFGHNHFNAGDKNDVVHARNNKEDYIDCGAGAGDVAWADAVDQVVGCERVSRTDERPADPDTDGDGVADFPDRCPESAGPGGCPTSGPANPGGDEPGGEDPGGDDPPPPPKDSCSNGKDDDGDELADFGADPGCASPADSDENSPPIAGCNRYKVGAGKTLTVQPVNGVLADDLDPEGGLLDAQFVRASFPRSRLKLSAATGGFSYKAPKGSKADVWFEYRAKDRGGLVSPAARVTIGIGDLPEACSRQTQDNLITQKRFRSPEPTKNVVKIGSLKLELSYDYRVWVYGATVWATGSGSVRSNRAVRGLCLRLYWKLYAKGIDRDGTLRPETDPQGTGIWFYDHEETGGGADYFYYGPFYSSYEPKKGVKFAGGKMRPKHAQWHDFSRPITSVGLQVLGIVPRNGSDCVNNALWGGFDNGDKPFFTGNAAGTHP